MRPVGMLSDAALPLMILVLGMQIERATMPERPVVVAAAVVVSLVLTPLAAIGWAHVVGLQGAGVSGGRAAVVDADGGDDHDPRAGVRRAAAVRDQRASC